MIGHYLMTLTPEQEDRLLTQMFGPIAKKQCGRCMVLVAMDLEFGHYATGLTEYESRYSPSETIRAKSPGWRYEFLCERFGERRVNAAIRSRILANRASRVLRGATPHVEVPSVAE